MPFTNDDVVALLHGCVDVVVKWYNGATFCSSRRTFSPHPLGLVVFHKVWSHSWSLWLLSIFFGLVLTTQEPSLPTHTNLTFCKPFPSNSLWLPPLTPRMLPSRSCPKLVPSQLTVGGSGNLQSKRPWWPHYNILHLIALVFVVAVSTDYLAINPNDDASRWKNHPKFAGAQVCGCVKGTTGTRVLCRYKKGTIEVTRTNTRTQTLYPYKDLAAFEGLCPRVVAPYHSYIDNPSPLLPSPPPHSLIPSTPDTRA